MKIAVIGASGLVGGEMLKVLQERGFSSSDILAVASDKSIGKTIHVGEEDFKLAGVDTALEMKPNVVLFSAGGSVSLRYAPLFMERGAIVIDNSSAWRMEEHVPLVVPQINAASITPKTKLISNPNCSTIQLVMALSPLHRKYGLKRVVVSTYQSVTGTGFQAVKQLKEEQLGNYKMSVYPHPIHENLFPHGGDFLEDGYTTEEQKLLDESRKILSLPNLALSATVVRVPVLGGHSEAVNIEFEKDFALEEVRAILNGESGIIVADNPKNNIYPTPLDVQGKDQVFIGRIRRDYSQSNTLNLWIVADNLRKGAATNAVEIMELPEVQNQLR